MKSSRKTDSLINDIARLFVTYSRTDWQPILDELGRGSEAQTRIAAAIDEIIGSVPAVKQKGLKKQQKKAPFKVQHAERAEAIAALGTKLRRGELLPNTSALKEAWSRTGAKSPLPKSRSAAISAILEQLDRLSAKQYDSLMAAMLKLSEAGPADLEGDYGRWFSMILDRPVGPSGLQACHFEVLSLMDRALVRGAESFSDSDAQALRSEKEKWLRLGGTPEKAQIIDRFLRTTALASGARQEEMLRLNGQVVDLKSAWRNAEPKK